LFFATDSQIINRKEDVKKTQRAQSKITSFFCRSPGIAPLAHWLIGTLIKWRNKLITTFRKIEFKTTRSTAFNFLFDLIL
jgi:hypothetical protein